MIQYIETYWYEHVIYLDFFPLIPNYNTHTHASEQAAHKDTHTHTAYTNKTI